MSGKKVIIVKILLSIFFISLIYVFYGCQPKIPREKGYVLIKRDQALKLSRQLEIRSQELENWSKAEIPLQRSLEYIKSKPKQGIAIQRYGLKVTWGELATSIKVLISILPNLDQQSELLVELFDWYKIHPSPLYTGYYEPRIKASLQPTEKYRYPLYGRPENLKVADLGKFHPRWEGQKLIYFIENNRIKPYPTRQGLEQDKKIAEEAPILAWAENLIDVFFLQIQGSGQLLLPDGQVQHIGYAGKNGRKYVSLGRVLLEKGYLKADQLSMPEIKTYLNSHPELLPEILYTNPSYVFFQKKGDGPYGAIQKKLTPMFSFAVDPEYIALGSIFVYKLDLSREEQQKSPNLTGIGTAQDVGGAIKGHHLDMYTGSGKGAGEIAGCLKEKGDLFLLLVKDELVEKVDLNAFKE